jgi:hypothetical protein
MASFNPLVSAYHGSFPSNRVSSSDNIPGQSKYLTFHFGKANLCSEFPDLKNLEIRHLINAFKSPCFRDVSSSDKYAYYSRAKTLYVDGKAKVSEDEKLVVELGLLRLIEESEHGSDAKKESYLAIHRIYKRSGNTVEAANYLQKFNNENREVPQPNGLADCIPWIARLGL